MTAHSATTKSRGTKRNCYLSVQLLDFNFLLNNQVGRLFTKRTSIQLENQKSLRHYLTREALPREDHYRWLHISNPMALLIRAGGQREEKYDVLCSPS